MLQGEALVAFVPTADLDRSHAFYGGVLGLPRVDASAFANAYEAGATAVRVTLVDAPAAAGYTVLGWRVRDIKATMAGLRSRGVAFVRYPGLAQDGAGVWTAPSGSRIAWFRDPDGNTLSLQEAPSVDA